MHTFSHTSISLSGTRLIEASAGTGKTYTITDMVLRLVLEGSCLQISEILVVTFTEAATEELRDRIRGRLKTALRALRGEEPSEDPLISSCCMADAAPSCRRLQQALSRFDEAAIYTIHGFCQRVLRDFAYESGMQFETGFVTAQEPLVQEVVDDVWREHAAGASLLYSAYLLEQGTGPDRLKAIAAQMLHNPLMRVVPDAGRADTQGAEARYCEAFRAAAREWPAMRESVLALLTTGSLNRRQYKIESISNWFVLFDAYFSEIAPPGLPPEQLAKLTRESLATGTRKNQTVPQHPFFETCSALWDAGCELKACYEQNVLWLKTELCRGVRSRLDRKKLQRNVMYFDDLLLRVYQGLDGPGGAQFAARVRKKFKAALIDEFQDTDQVQYTIFQKIFQHRDTALFFVGDPKQAIYSFRSADVYTYLAAGRATDAQHTLGVNWRSAPELIEALAVLFGEHARPFVLPEIRFAPIAPAPRQQQDGLSIDGTPAAGLQLCLLRSGKAPGKKTPAQGKPAAEQMIAAAVAREIAALIGGSARLGGRRVVASDIAVLVRTHAQARRVQRALGALRVPCIVQNSGNLFATREAAELALVLAGVAGPDNECLVRSALATELLGYTAGKLLTLGGTSPEWHRELRRFQELHTLWRKSGFHAMARRLLLEYRVTRRIVAQPDGERRVTNVLHLVEVLHRRSVEGSSGMWALQRWLARQLSQDDEAGDEFLLRLESDRTAVAVVTMHKSKGLEFEIVFCPYTWKGSGNRGDAVVYHDEGGARALDVGSGELAQHKQQAEEEALAENVRLLYVAVTRARQRCYLYWGGLSGAETSAPAYLFHNRQCAADAGAIETTRALFEALSDDEIFAAVRLLQERRPDCIGVQEIAPDSASVPPVTAGTPQAAELACKIFEGGIVQPWRITSFSALISGRQHEPEAHERDTDEHASEVTAGGRQEQGIYQLPPGPVTGSMLHAILERCSFSRERDEALSQLAARTLADYQMSAEWLDVVCAMACAVARQPLAGGCGQFCLADTAQAARVPELGFHLPLKRITAEALAQVFERHRVPNVPGTFAAQLGRLTFAPVNGFLKGFIDLVFEREGRYFLIDWKSNLLGTRPDAYHPQRLGDVMAGDYYMLQYHLYALALHEYLLQRMPGYRYETHFGGVYYIFLRGLQPEDGTGYGVFQDRPPFSLIQRLRAALIDDRQAHGR